MLKLELVLFFDNFSIPNRLSRVNATPILVPYLYVWKTLETVAFLDKGQNSHSSPKLPLMLCTVPGLIGLTALTPLLLRIVFKGMYFCRDFVVWLNLFKKSNRFCTLGLKNFRVDFRIRNFFKCLFYSLFFLLFGTLKISQYFHNSNTSPSKLILYFFIVLIYT